MKRIASRRMTWKLNAGAHQECEGSTRVGFSQTCGVQHVQLPTFTWNSAIPDILFTIHFERVQLIQIYNERNYRESDWSRSARSLRFACRSLSDTFCDFFFFLAIPHRQCGTNYKTSIFDYKFHLCFTRILLLYKHSDINPHSYGPFPWCYPFFPGSSVTLSELWHVYTPL